MCSSDLADPSVSFPAAIRIGEQLRDLGNPAGQALIDIGREAFMTGMTSSAGASALISLTAAVLVFKWMPRSPPEASLAVEEEE